MPHDQRRRPHQRVQQGCARDGRGRDIGDEGAAPLDGGSVLWKDSTAEDPVAVKLKVSGTQLGGPKGDSVVG